MKTYNGLLSILKRKSYDPKHWVCGRELCRQLEISGESLRKLVHEARVDGHLIASCRRGYRLTKNKIDISITINHLKGREFSIRKARKALERAIR